MAINNINHIYIPFVDISYIDKSLRNLRDISNYITYKFLQYKIAKIKKIVFEQYGFTKSRKKLNNIKYVAYIEIDYWCDTEIAYNFIKRLKNQSIETRFIYQDENWWTVRINKFHHKYLNTKYPIAEFYPNVNSLDYCNYNDEFRSFNTYDKYIYNNTNPIISHYDKGYMYDIDMIIRA